MSVRESGSAASGQDNAEIAGAERAGAAQRALDALRSSDQGGSAQRVLSGVRRSLAESQKLLGHPIARVLVVATAIILLALVAAAAIVVFIVKQPSSPSSVTAAVPASTSTSTTTIEGVVLAVAGAVRTPGVYRLAHGARVVDALQIAGGPAEDIDLDRLNLAAPVLDGERVWFPRVGEVPPLVTKGPEIPSAATQGTSSGPIDLNSATLEQLDSLPGIGPATAKAILERRTQVGRFRSVDDLLSVKGIGSSKLDTIRSAIVVR